MNRVAVCQLTPASILNSQSSMMLSVMLFDVADNNVGAAGAVCVCLVIGPTGAEVTLLSQLAAVTVTVIIAPMSVEIVE